MVYAYMYIYLNNLINLIGIFSKFPEILIVKSDDFEILAYLTLYVYSHLYKDNHWFMLCRKFP